MMFLITRLGVTSSGSERTGGHVNIPRVSSCQQLLSVHMFSHRFNPVPRLSSVSLCKKAANLDSNPSSSSLNVPFDGIQSTRRSDARCRHYTFHMVSNVPPSHL